MPKLDTHEHRQIVQMFKDGMSEKDLAKEFNVASTSITYHLKRSMSWEDYYNIRKEQRRIQREMRVDNPKLDRPGPKGKLDDQELLEIVFLWRMGQSLSKIAHTYGVSAMAIRYHVHHIPQWTPDHIITTFKNVITLAA